MKFRLKELKNWLLKCNCPNGLIDQAFHKAKLQGPAQNPENNIIPLVTTYYPSLNYEHIMKTIANLFRTISDPDTKRKFKDTKPVLALKKPPNLTSMLTKAKFTSVADPRQLKYKIQEFSYAIKLDAKYVNCICSQLQTLRQQTVVHEHTSQIFQ